MSSTTLLPIFLVVCYSNLISADGRYQSRDGHPADHLPEYIEQVSGFGERPEWSHDSKRILFVDKPMGEVYELDLDTGLIDPKTRHFNHFGFTRAAYLANGDILLSGPNEPFDPTDRDERLRARHQCWLSVLDKSGTKPPVLLNTLCAEGPAVSRTRMRLAWTHRDQQLPEFGKNHAQLLMADIEYENGVPKLANQRVVLESRQLRFHLGQASLETQNLVPPEDAKLIFSVYQIEDGTNTDTYIVDTETGEFRNLTRSPNHYDEPEGVFPDGKFTCVEHAPSNGRAWPLCDIYKLKLDGSGEMQRLTHFSEFKGYKGTQGVVSPDGLKLCFQIGKSGDEAGVGYGFFVMDLEQAAEYLGEFESFAEDEKAFERHAFAMPERCDRALAIDSDADGDLDLVGICRTQIMAVRMPEVKPVSLLRAEDGAMIHGAPWDADGDGDDDIAVCRFQKGSGPAIFWLENPGWKVHAIDNEVDGVHGLATGDLNGDGRDDLIAANINGIRPLSISWYDGVSKSRQFIHDSNAGSRPHYLAVADLNGDEKMDIVSGAGDAFAWYRGPDWNREVIDEKAGATNVAVADVNGDGKPDVLGSCGHGAGVFWYRNPKWERTAIERILTDVHALNVGDLDGDGDIDIAAGSFGGYGTDKATKRKLFWYENDGTGRFEPHDLDVDHAQESYALEIVDLDADGRNDIIIGGRGSENVVWYRNVTNSTDSK
ncbi:MAG: FG-GAP-like repeat-containing protein [Verrucomicrobiota bacterium]